MTTGGIYLAGGIAPKILKWIEKGRVMKAFSDKGRFSDLLSQIPVKVILNKETALLGAAIYSLPPIPDPRTPLCFDKPQELCY